MRIIQFLSDTRFYGSNLGISIFYYAFLMAGVILSIAVINQKRPMAVLSYTLAIINLLYFMAFYDLDMYRKLPLTNGSEVYATFGSGVITGLINSICIATIFGLLRVIKRLRSDYRYYL